MKFLRLITESLRAKVGLLVIFWAVLMLSSMLVTGILSAEGGEEIKMMEISSALQIIPVKIEAASVAIVSARRPEPKAPGFKAASEEEAPEGDGLNHQAAIQTHMNAFMEELLKLETGREDQLKKHLPQPMVYPGNKIRQALFRWKASRREIQDAVAGIRAEWEMQKPVFDAVLAGEPVTPMEIRDATAALEDRGGRLNDTIRALVDQKILWKHQVNLILFFSAFALPVFFFLVINRLIIHPIEKLRGAARDFTEGRRDVHVDITSSDEIGKLAFAFNTMTATLSERERVEDARQRELAEMNEELKKASEMKSQFLATMSHELRTPMNSIIGYSEVLLDGLDGDLNAEQTEDVKSVLRSAEHLLKLINDILDLSKIEAGRMKVEIGEVKVREVINEAASTIEPLVQEKKLRYEVVYLDDDVVVRVDRDRLKQILLNLLSNAVKFTETGGIKVRVMKEEDFGVIAVEDTGIGIPADQVDAVFQEFHQVDGATTRKYGGTGLGLAIVRKFVELMGGTITATSRLGVGSTFRVRLPLAYARSLEVGDSSPTILIVDDDPETVLLYNRYLTKERIRILSAGSVSEGRTLLEKLPAGAISAALLDIKLPDGSGYDLLDFIRKSRVWLSLPVAVVSITDERRRSASMGADAHIVKPVNRQDLLRLVETLCKRGVHEDMKGTGA